MLKIAIGIPTSGRAAVLLETLKELSKQTLKPERVVVCYTKDEDVADIPFAALGVEAIRSHAAGLPLQRNIIIDRTADCDVLVFFDDDFLAMPDYLEVLHRLFMERPDVVVATGNVIADGICGPGLSVAEGRRLLAEAPATVPDMLWPVENGYGCNMAVRSDLLRRHNIRFDERLPFYGWQEDADLCCRLNAYGRNVGVAAARGVHLGVKVGRSSGLRLGYSQIANPIYIARKTPFYTWRRALGQIGRNVVSNILRSPRPEPYVDRRGRLRGNLLAVRDFFIGRMAPERVREL